jgi:hypothetical protein
MPPYVIINQEDIEDFYTEVDSYLNMRGGLISSAVLFSYAHPLVHFYNEDLAKETIEERYEKSGKKLGNRYDLWRKKLGD